MKHMSDKEFDKQFREKLGHLSSTPSELNWIGIEGNLDAASHGKKRRLWWIPIVAAILMAGGAGYWMWSGAENQPSEVGAIKARSLTPQTFTIKINAVEDVGSPSRITAISPTLSASDQLQASSVAQNLPASRSIAQTNGITNNSTGSTSRAGSSKNLSGFDQSNSSYLQSLSLGAIDRESSEEPQNSTISWENDLLNADHTIKSHKLTGFYVGPSAVVAHTQTKSPALNQWSEINGYAPKFSTGGSFGLAMGYDFNAHFGLHGELQFNSIQNQAYERATNISFRRSSSGEGGAVDFEASYTRIPIYLKYRTLHFGGLTKRPSAFQYLLGFSYGRLNWVDLPDWVERVQPDDFNMQEWGIVAGAEYVTHLHEHYSLTVGLRGGYYGHNTQSPFLLGQSPTDNYMFQLGLTARLQFHLPKAEK